MQVPNDDCANATLLGNLGNLKIIINSLNTYEKDLTYIYYWWFISNITYLQFYY